MQPPQTKIPSPVTTSDSNVPTLSCVQMYVSKVVGPAVFAHYPRFPQNDMTSDRHIKVEPAEEFEEHLCLRRISLAMWEEIKLHVTEL